MKNINLKITKRDYLEKSNQIKELLSNQTYWVTKIDSLEKELKSKNEELTQLKIREISFSEENKKLKSILKLITQILRNKL